MLRVGLTGGIGSGKSTVSAMLAERGAVVIDYDLLAREVVEPGSPGLAAIERRFGAGVIAADGRLDRPALGAIVFGDAKALADLNAITHPAVRARAAEREQAAADGAIVVHDIPLLVESLDSYRPFDVVIVVDVSPEVQLERLTAIRGMARSDALARIGAQASRETRTGAADLVIDNTGPRSELALIVGGAWDELVSRAAARRGPGGDLI